MATASPFRLGTRKSELAKVQSTFIRESLRKLGVECRLVEIESKGDVDRKTPLYEIDDQGPGLFTKQLEDALLRNEIDLAVHSLKDLPTDQPPELRVAAVPKRETSADCLVVAKSRFTRDLPLGLPQGARVGTSSLRREALIREIRPDLSVVPIRGNVPTRVRKAATGEVDAVMLAGAGVARLGLSLEGLVRVDLDEEGFVSAPGQGALAIETRRDAPAALAAALERLHDSAVETETRAERAVLKGLHGGCTLPLGVRCRTVKEGLTLNAFLGLLKKGPQGREWLGFSRFETIGSEKAVVEATVKFFLAKMKEAGATARS